MPVAQYTIGPPRRPNIQHDNGHLDKFPPRAPTSSDFARRAMWLAKLEGGEAIQGVPLLPHNDLPDALPAYRHFHFGGGKDRTFSYERYVACDRSGKVTLANAVIDARQGAEQIYTSAFYGQLSVHFQMTGSAIHVGSGDIRLSLLFPYPDTENWQKALGAHVIWISAGVDVELQKNILRYSMTMTVHAEDRFNFNPGAKDIATGIPDSENGIFEITGLAKQYMNYGTLLRTVNWSGTTGDQASISRPDSGRERKPEDNRRIRNRL